MHGLGRSRAADATPTCVALWLISRAGRLLPADPQRTYDLDEWWQDALTDSVRPSENVLQRVNDATPRPDDCATVTSCWIVVRVTLARRRHVGSSTINAMSTQMMSPLEGGSGVPSIVESITNCSGVASSQPSSASTPSASASSAVSKRRIVEAATPTSRESRAHVSPRTTRFLSISRPNPRRSNSPGCELTLPSVDRPLATLEYVNPRDQSLSPRSLRLSISPQTSSPQCTHNRR